MVMGAFARASAMPTAKTGAVYMTLKNQARRGGPSCGGHNRGRDERRNP